MPQFAGNVWSATEGERSHAIIEPHLDGGGLASVAAELLLLLGHLLDLGLNSRNFPCIGLSKVHCPLATHS